jgi:hypothetical protein
MRVSGLRKTACWIMVGVVPASLWAADSSPAMLYARGATWINGGAVPRTSAVFPGDMVQTQSDSLASINVSGSNVVVLADSLVKFEGPAVALEHGSLKVATSKGLSTHTGDLTVAPASNGWTEFEVEQMSDDSVQIVAQKGDVTVSDGSNTSTLSQGQQTTVDNSAEKKKKKRKKGGGAIPAGGGAILASPLVIYGGAAAVGGLLTWVLLQGGGTPVSAAAP